MIAFTLTFVWIGVFMSVLNFASAAAAVEKAKVRATVHRRFPGIHMARSVADLGRRG